MARIKLIHTVTRGNKVIEIYKGFNRFTGGNETVYNVYFIDNSYGITVIEI